MSGEVFMLFLILGVGIGMSVLIAVIGLEPLNFYQVEPPVFGPVQPIAMNNMVGETGFISGSIFITVGTFSDVEYYVFYYQQPDGAIVMGKVSADSTKIYEINGTPSITTWEHKPKGAWLGDDKAWPDFTTTIIKVPPGTVKRNINLDLGAIK